jgi:hypothetical protein
MIQVFSGASECLRARAIQDAWICSDGARLLMVAVVLITITPLLNLFASACKRFMLRVPSAIDRGAPMENSVTRPFVRERLNCVLDYCVGTVEELDPHKRLARICGTDFTLLDSDAYLDRGLRVGTAASVVVLRGTSLVLAFRAHPGATARTVLGTERLLLLLVLSLVVGFAIVNLGLGTPLAVVGSAAILLNGSVTVLTVVALQRLKDRAEGHRS